MNKKNNFGLGKGLGALIPDASILNPNVTAEPVVPEEEVSLNEIRNIPVDRIDANPFQPRQTFEEDALNELADSIRHLGLIQPITVRVHNDRYQIISGERRFRASRLAGLTEIPAYVRTADDQGMLELAIVENIQRENLDAIEVALSFRRLIEECELTQEQMAERVGKKRATITNYLRLLKLPAEIQLFVRSGKLSMGHARALLGVEDRDLQLSLCAQVMDKDLSVRQLEMRIQQLMEKKRKDGTEIDGDENSISDDYYHAVDHIGRYFKKGATIRKSANGGVTISIHVSDDAEVEKFVKALDRSTL